jgi:nitrite reductase (NADH) small subunit
MTTATLAPPAYRLGPAERIPPGEGRTYRVGDTRVAVFRTRAGELFATQAECPHRGGPLADGILGAGAVVCPLHARKFDLASGRPLSNDCPALCTYPISMDAGGELVLRLEE